MKLTRRQFLEAAIALGAGALWVDGAPRASTLKWQERRELYPQGVASRDPQADSVILWTRYVAGGAVAPEGAPTTELTVEVALDMTFHKVVATTTTRVLEESDGTCRVLVGNLRPRTIYWYRFTDAQGNGSRIGRTITAPGNRDSAPVKFAFVSCQTINEGAMNAYRRMLHEDRRAAEGEQLGFVLHLGDFIYEVVQYPDEVKTRYDRTIYDIGAGRISDTRKVGNLKDPDIQDARVPAVRGHGDNHEFSWQAWQRFIKFGAGEPERAQALKVAANQSCYEPLARSHPRSPRGLIGTAKSTLRWSPGGEHRRRRVPAGAGTHLPQDAPHHWTARSTTGGPTDWTRSATCGGV